MGQYGSIKGITLDYNLRIYYLILINILNNRYGE